MMNEQQVVAISSARKLDRKVTLAEYKELKTAYQRAVKRNQFVEKTYKKYSERLVENCEVIDRLKMEVIDGKEQVSRLSKRLHEQMDCYSQLLEEHNALRQKHLLAVENSWLLGKIDSLQKTLCRNVDFTTLNKAIARFRALIGFNKDCNVPTLSEKVSTKPFWLSTTKAMPISTGMYRVSDGEKVMFTYYDGNSHTFGNHEFNTRYWQFVS